MPKIEKDKPVEKLKIDDQLAHTVLIGEDPADVYYYQGLLDTLAGGANIKKIDLSPEGLRKIMQQPNAKVIKAVEELKTKFKKKEIKEDTTYKRLIKAAKADTTAPFVIVKTLPKSKYKTVIDVIDELTISQVSKYTIVDMSKREKEYIDQKFPKK